MGNTVKKGAKAVKKNVGEKTSLFLTPILIRIVDRDKKRAESEVCQGSIGFESDQKGLYIVNIFRDSIDAFNLMFYPDCDGEFYYIDPSERQRYIVLDEYFSYLKISRVNELRKIAQALGAKHFKVTYKEEQTSFSEKKVKSHIKAAAMITVKTTTQSLKSPQKWNSLDIRLSSLN